MFIAKDVGVARSPHIRVPEQVQNNAAAALAAAMTRKQGIQHVQRAASLAPHDVLLWFRWTSVI